MKTLLLLLIRFYRRVLSPLKKHAAAIIRLAVLMRCRRSNGLGHGMERVWQFAGFCGVIHGVPADLMLYP